MIRRLMLLNLALIALLVWLGMQLRDKMALAKQRETAMLQMRMAPTDIPKPPPLGKVPPVDATAYQDTVTKNLFSRDRNPVPIPDPPAPPPAPPPVPPFPVARGVMIWGGLPPTVVLSSRPGANDQRGYHIGDKVGEWKILAVDNQFIVLDWNGKQFKKRLDELMDRTPIQMAEAPVQQTAAPAAAPVTKSLAETKGLGADMGLGVRACIAGDTQPAGTVVDGMKKVVSQTPFSTVCRWEPTK